MLLQAYKDANKEPVKQSNRNVHIAISDCDFNIATQLALYRISRKRGAALITVLVIVFIIMTIITNITYSNYRVIQRLTNQKIKEQSYATLITAVNFGRAGLATSGATSQIDTLSDLWAQPLPKTWITDTMQMGGHIEDEQGKFNINDLIVNGNVNTPILEQFSALLSYLNIAPTIATSIALYMADPSNENTIMRQYTTDNPPSRPAGRPLIDISELLLVKGVSQDILTKLAPYITAIPVAPGGQNNNSNESSTQNGNPANAANSNIPNINSNPNQVSGGANSVGNANIAGMNPNGTVLVNVNTASAEVIAARSGIPLSVAQTMVTARNVKPFTNSQDIQSFVTQSGIILQNANGPSVLLSVFSTQSSYFTIHATATSGDYEFKWIALVNRASRGAGWPTILWQHPE